MGILKPFLPEDVRLKVLENIKGVIESNKGKILKENIWGKRHLAYKIKGHEEGYYILYGIDLPCEKIEEINKEFRMINDLLRYIVIQEREK